MNKKAALIIIGNEILSGRTKDANLNYLALKFGDMGVDFCEARVIPDEERAIIDTVRELSEKYDYVITTGGIGTTHDDITAECVAKAFGLKLIQNQEAIKRLKDYYQEDFTDSRGRMAQMPEGSEIIDNPLTIAPGFQIRNVFVLAGVPSIMQAMFDSASHRMVAGKKILSETVFCYLPESYLAKDLEDIQNQFPELSIGSYPGWRETGFQVHLVIRGKDAEMMAQAKQKIDDMVEKLTQSYQTKRA